MISTIDVSILHREGKEVVPCTVTERYSTDFIIDGRSLYRMIVDLGGEHPDLMGPFVAEWEEHNAETADIFLLRKRSDLKNGRVMLFICPECGDLGCGAVTMQIEREDGAYVWSRFGYDDNHSIDYDSYSDIGPFRFDPEEYDAVIERASRPILKDLKTKPPRHAVRWVRFGGSIFSLVKRVRSPGTEHSE